MVNRSKTPWKWVQPGCFLLAATACAVMSVGAAQVSDSPPYDRLRSLLRPDSGKKPPANIDQVLDALPEELLSNFTLVYASRSPHRDEIDPLFPRVVLFTTDAKLLLAFTGNPAAASYNRLEVIYFDDQTSSFHTSRFILVDAITRDPNLKQDAALNGAVDRFECTRCHGADVRPIFDSYGLWPGFYGSRTDRLSEDTREKHDFVRFLSENARKGVYRHLRFPGGSPLPPYQDASIPLAAADALRFHPNERLGDALTPLNWKRIGRKLASRGALYRRLRYSLLSGMVGCSTLPLSAAFNKSIEAALETENAWRFERAALPLDADNVWRFRMQELAPGVLHGISEVAYVAKALGSRRADWSMSFEPSALGFFDGVLTRPVLYVKEDLLTVMLGELASTDHEFARYYNPYYVFAPYGYRIGFKLDIGEAYGNPALCALLADRAHAVGAPPLESVEQIDEREREKLPPTPVPVAEKLKQCAACHESNTSTFAGVEVPFTDPVALRKKLRFERSLKTGRLLLDEMLARISQRSEETMPPASSGPPLSERDRRELANYFSALGTGSR